LLFLCIYVIPRLTKLALEAPDFCIIFAASVPETAGISPLTWIDPAKDLYILSVCFKPFKRENGGGGGGLRASSPKAKERN
jgi:hypothetical protein